MSDGSEQQKLESDGISRRSFLEAGARGAAGASLANLVPAALAATPLARLKSEPRNAIVILLLGGPSHIDTWDPKPDAPREFRNLVPAISTSVPGTFISEMFPRMAERLHKLALIRSLHHTSAPIHETGCQLMMTGRCSGRGVDHPHLGSVVSRLAGPRTEFPPNVILPGRIGNTGVNASHGQSAGFLGDEFEPQYMAPVIGRSVAMQQNNAVSLACDLDAEPAALREQYGHHPFGQSCLLARRLIEHGVRVCTINHGTTVFDTVSWDMHANGGRLNTTIADYHALLCPQFDQAFAALVDDLETRGLLTETVVSVVSEMGRTPRINARGGRDHWTGAWTNLMAGGPIPGGLVHGATDRNGAEPVENPVTPAEFCATFYEALGIDAANTLIAGPDGHPLSITDSSPVASLLSC